MSRQFWVGVICGSFCAAFTAAVLVHRVGIDMRVDRIQDHLQQLDKENARLWAANDSLRSVITDTVHRNAALHDRP
jgi:hypothetical protein